MFWFKRKKIVVDCFINIPAVHELFKIDKASKFMPKEWKALPAFENLKANEQHRTKMLIPISTSKRCIALSNLFSTGFVIPAWTDFGVEVFHDGTFNIQNPMKDLRGDTHPSWMYWDTLYKGYQHIKLYNPWLIREKSGIQFHWSQIDYQNTERHTNVHMLPGVVDYQAQHDTHINMFVKKETVTHFNAGEPLIQIVPITEHDVEINCHLIDHSEHNRITQQYGQKLMWFGQHRAQLNKRKEEQSRCPFNFSRDSK